MSNTYNQAGIKSLLRPWALALLLAGGATAAQAQNLPYSVSTFSNTAGTYTDLGTTGTAITTPNFDDANSAATSIGFSFTYNGTAYTDFVLNTNGYLKLGTTAPAAPYFSTAANDPAGGPLNSAETNLILPFNTDLEAGSSPTEYRVATTGTAPNRVTTIQWKNVSDKTRLAGGGATGNIDKQYANFSFQVKLYEAASRIEFVYGTATPSTNTSNPNFVVVGLKGSGTASAQIITVTKASNTSWSDATAQAGVYTGNAHNIRNAPSVAGATVLPDPGRTYSFSIPQANDAAVQAIYTYNQLAVPAGSPTTIQAAIQNVGTAAISSSVTVTLTVSGANTVAPVTQVISSLALNAVSVVSFPNIALPNVGNNTVTVSVTPDNNTSNDSRSMLVVTNPTTFSYFTPGGSSAGVVFAGPTGPETYFAAKITLTASRDITAVRATISEAAASATSKTSVGEVVYGVVVDPTSGAILGRSPNYTITTADLNVQKTFTLSSPVTVPAGDVLIGMARVATSAAGVSFFPYFVQNENPTRPNTFYGGSVTSPGTPALALTGANAIYKFPFEAVTATPATCPTPTGVTVAGTPTSATLTFSGPSVGTNYTIVYGAPGFNPTTGGTTVTTTASPFTISGLTGSTAYQFYIRTQCGPTDQSGFAGPFSFTTPCTPPIISTFPYTENFDVLAPGQPLPCGITVVDANNDGVTWQARGTVPTQAGQTNVASSAPNAMTYLYNTTSPTIGGDDWFFTPALSLRSGTRYQLSFKYRSSGTTYSEGLEVKYGSSNTPAGQTNLLWSNTNIQSTPYLTTGVGTAPAVTPILPTSNGINYIGFHVISPGDQFFLAVDDMAIAATLGTSEALNRAVSVFPNPSATGRFDLEIHGANAKGALQVEVTNVLGQRVYNSTAKDNFTNNLDLSSLPAGIYHLKVKNGAEFTTQQLSIVK